MNVLHVIPAIAPRYGGPSEVVISLTKALIDAGIDAEIATTDADGRDRLAVSYGVLTEWRSVPVRFFRRQFGVAFKFSSTLERWLMDEVSRFDVVHIHAVFSHSSVAAFKACTRASVPYIVRPLGSLDPETFARKSLRKRLFGAIWGKRMLSQASAVHYSTTRERAVVEKSFGLDRGFIAPAGVATDMEHALRPRSAGVSRADSHREPYVLFLGRLDSIKRIELLIDAFEVATADSDLDQWRLVIAGDGEPGYVAGLRSRAQTTSARDRIEFPGWLSGERKMDALSGASLLALLSEHENFGRAAAEAMSMGVPVVISDDVYLADSVIEYQAGWVVSGTLQRVADTLHEAMRDHSVRKRHAMGARGLAIERLGIQESTNLLIARYASVAGTRIGDTP